MRGLPYHPQITAFARLDLVTSKPKQLKLLEEINFRSLFFGIEFTDSKGQPATSFTFEVVEAMRERGVLLNSIGRHRNTLKMRPPMPFSKENADLAIDTLETVLSELPL